jgi:DinB superfamily
MKDTFELLRVSRQNYLKFLTDYSLDELNTVPLGFKNNILWNIAHIVGTTDLLVNKLNGCSLRFDEEFLTSYTKGSQPEVAVNQAFVDQLKKDLIDQINWVEEDYSKGVFPPALAQPYTTSFGNTLTDIDVILRFLPLHEGLHIGIIMGLRKFI